MESKLSFYAVDLDSKSKNVELLCKQIWLLVRAGLTDKAPSLYSLTPLPLLTHYPILFVAILVISFRAQLHQSYPDPSPSSNPD